MNRAEIIPLRKRPLTGAERAKAYRDRKKARSLAPTPAPASITAPIPETATSRPVAAVTSRLTC